jgi:hypothetical protein
MSQSEDTPWRVSLSVALATASVATISLLAGWYPSWLGHCALGVAVGLRIGSVVGYVWQRVRGRRSEMSSAATVKHFGITALGTLLAVVLALHLRGEAQIIEWWRTIDGEEMVKVDVAGDALRTKIVLTEASELRQFAEAMRDLEPDRLRKVSVGESVRRWTIGVTTRGEEREVSIECWARESEPDVVGGAISDRDGGGRGTFQSARLASWLQQLP